MTNKAELEENFLGVFNEKPDTKKLSYLIKYFGQDRVNEALEYCFIFPPKYLEGKRNNPYGLLYIMCRKWDLNLENKDFGKNSVNKK